MKTRGAVPTKKQFESIVSKCDLAEIRRLVSHGMPQAWLANKRWNAVTAAARGTGGGRERSEIERLNIIKLLFDAGCPIGADALFWPIEADEIKIVRYLIANGADVNSSASTSRLSGSLYVAKGTTPLGLAIMAKKTAIVRLLIDSGANVNQISRKIVDFGVSILARPPIVSAAYANRPEIIRMLINAGADVNAVEPGVGDTALLVGIECGYVGVVKAIVSAGADSIKVSQIRAAIELAANQGNRQITKVLKYELID
jgi:hypothetical protein